MDLISLCGLKSLPPNPPTQKWLAATLKFLGPERYVLSTKPCEISLSYNARGFALVFNGAQQVHADMLFGRHTKQVWLLDVEIHFDDSNMPVFSMACMMPGRYPRVLRRGETVEVS